MNTRKFKSDKDTLIAEGNLWLYCLGRAILIGLYCLAVWCLFVSKAVPAAPAMAESTVTRARYPKGSSPKAKSYPGHKSVAYSGFVIPETGGLFTTKQDWFHYKTTTICIYQFLALHPVKDGKHLYIVMDNAPWHKKAKRLISEDGQYADIRETATIISKVTGSEVSRGGRKYGVFFTRADRIFRSDPGRVFWKRRPGHSLDTLTPMQPPGGTNLRTVPRFPVCSGRRRLIWFCLI